MVQIIIKLLVSSFVMLSRGWFLRRRLLAHRDRSSFVPAFAYTCFCFRWACIWFAVECAWKCALPCFQKKISDKTDTEPTNLIPFFMYQQKTGYLSVILLVLSALLSHLQKCIIQMTGLCIDDPKLNKW